MNNQRTFDPYKTYELCTTILRVLHESKRISFNTLLTRICRLQDTCERHDWSELQSAYESLKRESDTYHINIDQAIEHYR